MNKPKIMKFADGWWSVIFYQGLGRWGKWRGPFDIKGECELDLLNNYNNGGL